MAVDEPRKRHFLQESSFGNMSVLNHVSAKAWPSPVDFSQL